jgi:hypothetical protein
MENIIYIFKSLFKHNNINNLKNYNKIGLFIKKWWGILRRARTYFENNPEV